MQRGERGKGRKEEMGREEESRRTNVSEVGIEIEIDKGRDR